MSGRKVLVTGAARGIGRSTAELLIASGASVVINDLDCAAAEITAKEIGATAGIGADVSDENNVGRLVNQASEALGGLNGLVNNAGMLETARATTRQSLEDWRRVIEVNMQSVFMLSKDVASTMPHGGAIVNMLSVAGLRAIPAANSYGVSKAGVAMMTQTMACEFVRYGHRVNAIAPGFVETKMVEEYTEQANFDVSLFERRTPMGRLAKPTEIANVAVFLLSDLASYMTGAVIPVDGGWTAFGGIGDAAFT